MGKIYDLGIDVGSTTVKTVILDEGEFIYNKYERHFSKVRETVAEQLRAIRELYPEDKFRIAITGSAGLGIAEASGISFVQEVFSAAIICITALALMSLPFAFIMISHSGCSLAAFATIPAGRI